MIKTLFLHPLGPSLILALGGLLLLLLRHRGRPSERSSARWLLPGAFLFLVAASGVLLSLRRGIPGGNSAGVLQWNWQPLTVAGSSLAWRLDGWNWLAALLLLCVTAAILALQHDPANDPAGPARTRRTLWLAAAALSFVFADNVVTVATCWIFLTAALTLRLMPAWTADPAGRIWSLLGLAGLLPVVALVFLGEANARASLSAGPMPQFSLAALGLAALVLAGAYPFHLWVLSRGQLDEADRLALHVIAPIAGIWLLARVQYLAGPGWLHHPQWAALGALALLGTALAAWAAPDRDSSWRWVAINRSSLVVLTAYVAGIGGPAALVWPLVTFALGTGLLALGLTVRARWGWSLPAWLGALAIFGLPGTPGFLARFVLVVPDPTADRLPGDFSVMPVNLLLYGLILVSEILLVATLWELVTGPVQREPAPDPAARLPASQPAFLRLGATTVLLAVPVLLWGLWPRQPAILAGLGPGGSLPWTLLQALGEARRSVWTGLIVAGVGGAVLGWLRPRIFAGMRGWQEGITAIVSLEWLYRGAGLALVLAGSWLQYFARLGEGEGYLGWVALAALLLWVLLRL